MFNVLKVFLFSIGFIQVFANEKPVSFARDPEYKSRQFTLTTDFGDLKIFIHAAKSDLNKIVRVEEIIRNDLTEVIGYFQYVPKEPIHFNIDPYLLLSNGNAAVFPQNIINLYTHPSVENEHLAVMDDWMKGLILHEFVHVLHLSQTREYLDLGRKIFGTFPKIIPSITPRWFTEGIATWAESNFLPSGRLHNPLLRREFLIKMNNKLFCQTIDCMDEPGLHPNGQMSYWFGAHFLAMIEQDQPGTIKCLVEKNSGQLPFMLGSVFEHCTGNALQVLFGKFKEKLSLEYDKLSPKESLKQPSPYFYLSNAFGANDLQKGALLVGDKLIKVEDDKRREALVSYDLKEGITNTKEFPFPIVSISDVVAVDVSEGRGEEKEDWALIAFHKDPNFRKENRKFSFVNTETLAIEKEIDLGHDPLILKALSSDHFVSFSFDDDVFTIREKKQGEIERFISLPRNTTVVSAEWSQNKNGLWLTGHHAKESFLAFLDIKNFQFSILDRTKLRFESRVVDGKLLYKNANGKPRLISFDQKNGELFSEDISESAEMFYFNESAFVITNDFYAVHYLDEIGFKTQNEEERKLEFKTTNRKKVTFELLNPDTDKQILIPDTQDYFALNSLIPRWWFLSLASASNLSTLGIQTGFSDSVNRHFGSLTLESYTSERSGTFYGGSFNYNFRQDQWLSTLFGSRLVSENEVSKSLIIENEFGVSTSLRWLIRRFSLLPGIDFAYQDEDSLLSKVELKRANTRFAVNYQAMSKADFVQNFNFQTRLGIRFPDYGDSYKEWGANGLGRLQFWPELAVDGKFSYARLEKSGFDRGVIFGAGNSSTTTIRNFEFYGLNYGAVYGNEIISLRLNLDYQAFEFYRGYKLWPFFARDLHFIIGRDWISADRVIVGKQILRDKAVNSLWGGANFRWTAAYYIPIETKLIVAKVFNPDGGDVRETLLTFDAAVW